jgi:nucleoside phosphorylase
LVFTSTPNEYRSVSASVGREVFKKLVCSVVDCGPGRINASFNASKELAQRRKNQKGSIVIVGAGTAGSLSLSLKQGEVIVSNTVIISDWRMENGAEITVSPYGVFDYRTPEPDHVEKMILKCQDPLVERLLYKLPSDGFQRGRLLTSEAFVSGKDHKLKLGTTYKCLACDMESGVYGFIGNRLAKTPWFNIRIVADTLDETLGDYFAKERDMTEILGKKVVEALKLYESLVE